MKSPTRIVLVPILCALWAFAASAETAPAGSSAQSSCATPDATRFYCDRTAVSDEQRQRKRELGKILRSSLINIREIDDGFEFEYPGDLATYRAVTEWVPLERACCPFFEFGIRLEPAGGQLRVSLSGPDGIKSFIREEFRPLFER